MSNQFRMSRYLGIARSFNPQFASNGRDVFFLSNITGVPQVWRVEAPSMTRDVAWPDPLTFGTDGVKTLTASPAASDGRLIFGRDASGNENVQLSLLNGDGTGETPLTEGHDRAMHVLGEWLADGSEILFAANRRNIGLFDLYRMRVGQLAQIVWRNDAPGLLSDARFSPDGRHAVVSLMTGSTSSDLIEVDLDAHVARSLSPTREPTRREGAVFSADGRSLYVNTDAGSDYMRICRLDRQTLTLEPVVEQPWDVRLAGQSPSRRYLAYTVNVEGADELYVVDPLTGETRAAPRFSDEPGVVGLAYSSMPTGGVSFSPDGNRLAFAFSSAVRTSDVYVWDLPTNAVRPVTRSSHAGLPVSEFVAPELVHYPTFDGRQIPAWLLKPSVAFQRPLPVVVWVHGGPADQSRPLLNPFLQALAAKGYAVLVPNVRGSTGYGKRYMILDEVYRRMDSVADLAQAALWLQKQPDIRGDRIAVGGISYGGFMVLSALTQYPDLWAAGIDIVGMSSLVTFLENTSSYRRTHREEEYGSLANDREHLHSISPLSHVERIAAPLFVVHGRNDPRVPFSEAEQLVGAVRERGIECEFIVFDDEGHGVVKLKNQLVAYPAMMDFLERHLKG